MAVVKTKFGNCPDGKEISLYTIDNGCGMKAAVTDFGAILVNLFVPDAKGKVEDVVLGFDKAEGYFGNDSFFGSTVGPNANRICDAKFSIDGVSYQLAVNDGPNNLHSDKDKGYHKRLWNVKTGDDFVTFSLEDDDMDMGFPGNKKFSVTYTLTKAGTLRLEYHASSDKKTIFNPTNHTYFNLDGHASGKIEGHKLTLHASKYTPTVPGSIPTGEIVPVAGTVMDFTSERVVGKDIDADFEQLTMAGGYDHNWVIDGWDGSLRHFATLRAEKSGRRMEAYTTLPGVQFYAGNFIADQTGKGGVKYGPRMGLCLETQYYPDSINEPEFPSCVFGPERDYVSMTEYRFLND